jgi:hypothetical protein
MNTNHETRPDDVPEMGDLIDRLVSGELDETARGRVIAWLEAEPARWRLCGLAFLESQMWSHALGWWGNGDRDEVLQPATVASARSKKKPVQPWPRLGRKLQRLGYMAALAASVLVAFGLGVLSAGMIFGFGPNLDTQPTARSRSGNPDKPPVDPAIAVVEGDSEERRSTQRPMLASFTARAGALETTVHLPVVSVGHSLPETADAPPAVSDYVRQQWERRGFDVQTQRRYLFATLPDGERAVVPVDNVKFDPIPIHVY